MPTGLLTIGTWSEGVQQVEVSPVLAHLEFQKCACKVKLDVVHALLYDIVLGQDWLFDGDVAIYHKEHVVRIQGSELQLTVKSI